MISNVTHILWPKAKILLTHKIHLPILPPTMKKQHLIKKNHPLPRRRERRSDRNTLKRLQMTHNIEFSPVFSRRCGILLASAAILTGVLLRFWTLFFFEFKDDQFRAIIDAAETVRRNFLVSHGMMSGVGVPNPPGFCWTSGVFSFFARTPFEFATIFAIVSVSTIFVWLFSMKKIVSREKLLIVACLLSSSTALTIYSSNIWAQCLLPIVCVAIISLLARFIIGGKDICWISAFWLNGFAASLHFSGFFLFPLTISVLLKKRVSLKHLLAAILPVALIFLPFAIHLAGFLSGGGFHYGEGKIFAGRSLGFLFDFYSFGFMKYYLGGDLNRTLSFEIGALLAQSSKIFVNTIFCAMLFCGSLLLVASFVRAKRMNSNAIDEAPVGDHVVSVLAGIHIFTVTAAYLLLNIKTFPHYFLVTVPAGYILIADFALTKPFKKSKKALLASAVLLQIVLTSAVMFFIDSAGGHPLEYGVHHGTLERWRKEYEHFTQGRDGVSAVNIIPTEESIIKSSYSAIIFTINPKQDGNVRPDRIYNLFIRWDGTRMRYEHKWAERELGNAKQP
jgi:hypothetical protein